MEKNVIAVDNGNMQTKLYGATENMNIVFDSGFDVTYEPPISNDMVMKYDGKYYSIGQERFSQQSNKNEDENAFIMTIYCIGRYLKQIGLRETSVTLAVGLPLSRFGNKKEQFANYFKRSVRFSIDDEKYNVEIKDVKVYPQGVSAYYTGFSKVFTGTGCIVIDIGGFTVDLVTLSKTGQINTKKTESIERGIIKNLNSIHRELIKRDISCSDDAILDVIRKNPPPFFTSDEIQLIEDMTREYVHQLINKINELGYDTKISPVLFVGGGSLLLEPYLTENKKIRYYEFSDQFANARGYHMLAKRALERD